MTTVEPQKTSHKIIVFPQPKKKVIGRNDDGATRLACLAIYYTTLIQPVGSGLADFLLDEDGLDHLADAIRNTSSRKTQALIRFADGL